MVTLKQIANACGVSIASVSKALNYATDIGPETAERIRKMAEEMGYYPNTAARALKTNRTYNIGVLFDDDSHVGLTHEYFSWVLNAVKNGAERRGYDVTFISKNLDPGKRSYLEHCRYRNVDGVVIANVDFTDPAVVELIESNITVVTIDYVFDGHSAVLSDNANSMQELTEYVINRGHRQLAVIHGEMTAVTKARLAGFYKACQEHGIEIPEDRICSARYHDPSSSGRATRALLEQKDRPDCIFYPDDISLMGGMTEIEKHGLKIPEDISIVGYDGIPISRMFRPVLTTLKQDSERLGAEAARLLIDQIEDPKTFVPHTLTIPGEVQTGGTVQKLADQ